LSGGDGGGTSDGMEPRVKALEAGMEKVLGKLDEISKSIADGRLDTEKRFGALEVRLATIEGKLDTKASAASLERIDGQIKSIPTTWQTIAILVSLLGGITAIAFAISKLMHP